MKFEDVTPSDITVFYRSDCSPGEQCIRFGVDARLEGADAVDLLSRDLTPVAADLLEIAASVYAIDRMVKRPVYRGYDNGPDWGRKIHAVVPVREPERWSLAVAELRSLLAWLTDDEWEFSFVQADGFGLSTGQQYLMSVLPDDVEPALFSGGLDSSAGLAAYGASGSLLPVSVVTNNHMAGVQNEVLRGLRSVLDSPLPHVRFRVNLGQRITAAYSQESSQRSRGLLFLAAGIATALTLGRQNLWFCENGIGAVNLPYIRSQIGAHATKSAHPKTIHKAQTLIEKVTGAAFEFRTPFFGMTKAEVVSAVPSECAPAVSVSVSCDTSFASRIKGHPACGTCTSCLLRRQAVVASRYPWIDSQTVYRSRADATTRGLAAMLWQVSRLQACLTGFDPQIALIDDFPELTHSARFLPIDDLVRMFSAYIGEWPAFADSLGLRVADWFDGSVVGGNGRDHG